MINKMGEVVNFDFQIKFIPIGMKYLKSQDIIIFYNKSQVKFFNLGKNKIILTTFLENNYTPINIYYNKKLQILIISFNIYDNFVNVYTVSFDEKSPEMSLKFVFKSCKLKCYIKSVNKIFVQFENNMFHFYDVDENYEKNKKVLLTNRKFSNFSYYEVMKKLPLIIIKDGKSLISVNYENNKIEQIINNAHLHEITNLKKIKNNNINFITSDESGLIKFWNFTNFNITQIFSFYSYILVQSIDYSYSEEKLFLLDNSNNVKVYDISFK